MKKILLSILVMLAGISPVLPQETDSIIQLDEVMIEAPSNKTIIKKAIGNLHSLTKESIYGSNCQFIQIMESAGKVIQLTREYGYLYANGYSDKKRNEWDSYWITNFNPVYNARSLRYDIDGNRCWANVQEAVLMPLAERKLEAHRRFIDIQAPITGPETIGLAELDAAAQALPFDVENDYVLYAGPSKPVTLNVGDFAIFFPPLGAHAPCCCVPGGPEKIKKVVVKVAAD